MCNPSLTLAGCLLAVALIGTGAVRAAPQPSSHPAPAAIPRYLAEALSDPARPVADAAMDPWRKPGELIAFAGLGPGNRIADFMSGNGYFTRIFSAVVGPRGRVYAFLPTQQLAHCEPAETAGTRRLGTDPAYHNVRLLRAAADRFAAPQPLDFIWMSLSYHDLHDAFMAPTSVAAVNAALYRALKPGGILLVIDHAAAAGSGLRDTETLHRIDPQSLRSEITAAGFVLEAESGLLRNVGDAHTLAVFDPAIRHRTDQIVYKFRKPPRPAEHHRAGFQSTRPGS